MLCSRVKEENNKKPDGQVNEGPFNLPVTMEQKSFPPNFEREVMTSKETIQARIEAATTFMKLSQNPLFHKEFLLLTETDESKEYNPIIVAGPEERMDYTFQRFVDTGETQAAVVASIDGEATIRIISTVPENPGNLEIFDIYEDTTVYAWLTEENLYPEGIHVINGNKLLVSGDIYRKTIEKLVGFADN